MSDGAQRLLSLDLVWALAIGVTKVPAVAIELKVKSRIKCATMSYDF